MKRTQLSREDIEAIRAEYKAGLGVRPISIKWHINDDRVKMLVANMEKPDRHMTREQVVALREEWARNPSFLTQDELAAKYGVSDQQAKRVLRGETYRDYGGPILSREDFREIRERICRQGHDLMLPNARGSDGWCRECRRIARRKWQASQRKGPARKRPDRPRKTTTARKPVTIVTTKLVVELRNRFAAGEKISHLALDMDMNRTTVRNIVRGRTYAEVPGPTAPEIISPEFKQMVFDLRTEYRKNPREVRLEVLAMEHGLPREKARRIIRGESYRDLPGPISDQKWMETHRAQFCRNGHKRDRVTKDGICWYCRRDAARRYDKLHPKRKHSRKTPRGSGALGAASPQEGQGGPTTHKRGSEGLERRTA